MPSRAAREQPNGVTDTPMIWDIVEEIWKNSDVIFRTVAGVVIPVLIYFAGQNSRGCVGLTWTRSRAS